MKPHRLLPSLCLTEQSWSQLSLLPLVTPVSFLLSYFLLLYKQKTNLMILSDICM